MGYRILGFAVWKGAKLYLRRRYGDKPRKLAAGAVVLVAVGGLVVAQRRGVSGAS
jgi:hypothetical protein